MIRNRFYAWIMSLFLLGGIGILGVLWWIQINSDTIATQRADCAVVFGAAVWKGGKPSQAMEDRTLAGIYLWEQGSVDCLVFSGADAEPEVMAKIAKKAGIPVGEIELDPYGESSLATLQNLNPERSYILVSNDFHLGRLRMLSWKLGLNAVTHAAPYRNGHYARESYFIFREIFGTIWYALRLDI